MKFNRGDVVRLRSGGPQMTINDIKICEFICYYFDGKEIKSISCYEESLELADE